MKAPLWLRGFAATALLTTACLLAPAQSTPVYDVVSIKPHDLADTGGMGRILPGSYEVRNTSLKMLIANAYGVRMWLVFGLPAWAESARYDIHAKVSNGDPETMRNLTLQQRNAMLAQLLADRFGLRVHTETKEQPVYEMTVLPNGPKLHASAPPPPAAESEPPPKPKMNWQMSSGSLKATATPIATLANSLSYQVERVIVDKTGLTGVYDFDLHWTPADQADKANDNAAPGGPAPDLFIALKEQLGLRLTSARQPLPTVVVDAIHPPEPD